jgi:MinD-like ATPase involved in chromosome partitioning or flagellar assembly
VIRVVLAVGEPRGAALAAGLARRDVDVRAVVVPEALAAAAGEHRRDETDAALAAALVDADALVLHATRTSLTGEVVAIADRVGARIVPLCDDDAGRRLAAAFGLPEPLPLDADAAAVVRALAGDVRLAAPAAGPEPRDDPRTIAVWGPAGAPGRSTLAIELALELSRGGRHVGLVDADAHAPSLALLLGLADEGPGFPAACRAAERGVLDVAELTRIAEPLPGASGPVDVLTGINRPARWPELSAPRVAAALGVCRDWADHTVVDVAASLERDEEIVSDVVDGPRRNAATLAALAAADVVVAVMAADPLGVARFLRDAAELRAVVGATPVVAVANRLRPATVGVDARGQIRRTVERFTGIRDVWFVPEDRRAVDASLLSARPVGIGSPRSALTQAVRRVVGERLVPPAAPPAHGRRGRRRTGGAAAA